MTRLPYMDDDDEGAAEFINVAIRARKREPAVWAALAAPDRIEQTDRVLRGFVQQVGVDNAAWQARNRTARAELKAGLITREEHAARARAFNTWFAAAMTFRNAVRAELATLEPRLERNRSERLIVDLRRALIALATAVDEHQRAHRGEVSLADTALWARLVALRWPTHDNRFVSLADAVEEVRLAHR